VRTLAPCSCQGQALGPRSRGCQEIRTVNPKSPIPSFPRKREPRDFSHLPPGSPLARGRRIVCPQNFLTASCAGTTNRVECRTLIFATR
jgi:hypothetical protein